MEGGRIERKEEEGMEGGRIERGGRRKERSREGDKELNCLR